MLMQGLYRQQADTIEQSWLMQRQVAMTFPMVMWRSEDGSKYSR